MLLRSSSSNRIKAIICKDLLMSWLNTVFSLKYIQIYVFFFHSVVIWNRPLNDNHELWTSCGRELFCAVLDSHMQNLLSDYLHIIF